VEEEEEEEEEVSIRPVYVLVVPLLVNILGLSLYEGGGVAQLVETLHYKPEDHGFDSWWTREVFYCLNHSGSTMALG
jgi:hypothetical protein